MKNTIKKEINVVGKGLMKNQECFVRIKPSDSGEIRFYLSDSDNFVVADVENVSSTNNCVCLSNSKYSVMLVEHFMAACAFCNINSIDVFLTKPELPIFDGSSKRWVQLFKEAGYEKNKTPYYTVSEPVSYLNGKTHLIIVPDEELNITYSVNYNHPDYIQRWACYDKKKQDEIIDARTFGFLKDLKKFQLLGLAKGVTLENTVGLKDDGYTCELRSKNEPIKHKILDVIGDLYLTGVNPLYLKAQIVVKEAGHAVHVKTAKLLKNKLIEINK